MIGLITRMNNYFALRALVSLLVITNARVCSLLLTTRLSLCTIAAVNLMCLAPDSAHESHPSLMIC